MSAPRLLSPRPPSDVLTSPHLRSQWDSDIHTDMAPGLRGDFAEDCKCNIGKLPQLSRSTLYKLLGWNRKLNEIISVLWTSQQIDKKIVRAADNLYNFPSSFSQFHCSYYVCFLGVRTQILPQSCFTFCFKCKQSKCFGPNSPGIVNILQQHWLQDSWVLKLSSGC